MDRDRDGLTGTDLASILDALNNGIIVINLAGEIVFFNHAAARILNLPIASAAGKKLANLLPNSCCEKVLQDPKPFSEQLQINDHLFSASYSPYYQKDQLAGVVVSLQDGQELEELQNQLKETETLLKETQTQLTSLENIFEQAYDGVVVIDNNGIITRITKAYCRILQTDQKKAIGRYVTEIIPNSRMHIVARTGKAEIGEAMNAQSELRSPGVCPSQDSTETSGRITI